MYTDAERRRQAAKVMSLRDRVYQLQRDLDRPHKTQMDKINAEMAVQRAKIQFQEARSELQSMCSHGRFFDSEVAMALLL